MSAHQLVGCAITDTAVSPRLRGKIAHVSDDGTEVLVRWPGCGPLVRVDLVAGRYLVEVV